MVLPRWLARVNRVATNRVLGRLPVFATVRHVGRRSGRRYQTPIAVFRADRGYVAALTYGPGADWVRNVLAAGGCELRVRGEWVPLVRPMVVHDPERRAVPPVVRLFLAVPGAVDFLHLDLAQPER
ncbi:nitroreductase family deazaflavin-dependent oxidoreductase [Pseudonocardia eucalypti]|uniref:Nitroreductase family deazaflavin-dependent oxidoreductase n=1 Tax=Pseudonocardia eucalypti TaxID=648755 RepID=A0ABP9PVS1_9PSEU|nr:deazaflavin-dependent oxidoreductase (nitroreductase family) [Pseudonocardia eucalypti]